MSKYQDLTDEELVEIIRTKDKEAYQELVVRYQKKLIRYASYLLNDNQQAEDPVQNAFLKAYINLNSFNTKHKFSSWIYRIVHNESINYAKKQRQHLSLDEKANQLTELSNKTEEEELKELVKNSLAKLPLEYRAPLALFYLEGLKYEEISDVLRLPVSTVGTKINRAKKQIKTVLSKKGATVYAR